MPRILIADDHALVRRYVREILEQEGWKVCAEAATGKQAVALTTVERPDVVVLDLCMPDLNGLEAARQIHERFPQTAIFIITMYDPLELTNEVAAFGVRACLLKTDLHRLIAAVRNELQESRALPNPSSDGPVETRPDSQTDEKVEVPAEMLTPLEQQIVQMLAHAKSNKEIAAALSMTVKSVEDRRAAIMHTLKINSVLELVQYAVRMKLVKQSRNLKSPSNPSA